MEGGNTGGLRVVVKAPPAAGVRVVVKAPPAAEIEAMGPASASAAYGSPRVLAGASWGYLRVNKA